MPLKNLKRLIFENVLTERMVWIMKMMRTTPTKMPRMILP